MIDDRLETIFSGAVNTSRFVLILSFLYSLDVLALIHEKETFCISSSP